MILKFRDVENDLVYAKNEFAFTDSKIIAKEFNRRHDNILNNIKECVSDLENIEESHNLQFKVMRNTIKTNNNAQRESFYYEMNRGAFMFLMMKMKGKKANVFKVRFIKAFDLMEEWIKEREIGRGVRLSMTDSIKNYLPESPNKKFKYKHFTDLVYKKVLGKSKKDIETELGREIENLRDIFTSEQLHEIEKIENEISVLIKYGKNYQEIKEMIFNS